MIVKDPETRWYCWPFLEHQRAGDVQAVLFCGLVIWARVNHTAKWIWGRPYRVA